MKQTLDNPNFELLPRDDEVFLSRNAIDKTDVTELPEIITDHGKVYVNEIRHSDGSRSVNHSGIPNRPITDIASNSPYPLALRYEGISQHRAEYLLELGIPFDMTGFKHHHKLPNIYERATKQIEIAKYTASKYNRNPSVIDMNASSQGAMIAFVVNSIAAQHDLSVRDNQLWAGCFPERPRHAELPKLFGATVVQAIKMASADKPPNWRESLDMGGKQWLHHLKSVPTLMGGQVGIFARQMPIDTSGRHTTFDGDPWAFGDAWDEILDPYPNFKQIRKISGHHGAAFSREGFAIWQDDMEEVAADMRNHSLGSAALQAS